MTQMYVNRYFNGSQVELYI